MTALTGRSLPRRHGGAVLLAAGVALFLAVERTVVATGNPNIVPAAILLGAALVPATFLAFVSVGGVRPGGVGDRPPHDVRVVSPARVGVGVGERRCPSRWGSS